MAIEIAVRLDERHRRQIALVGSTTLEVGIKIQRVLQSRAADFVIRHDRSRILKEVTDIAVGVVGGDIVIIGIGEISIELFTEIGEGDVFLEESVADVSHVRWRYREYSIQWVADVGISIAAVTEVARIVVI